jgi:GntR family transcriptional regulator
MKSAGLFHVRPESGEPIYQQLIRQIKHVITAGLLHEGDQLPTVRELASQLVINPNTISRAYRELERDGMIESTRGRGTFVRHRPPQLLKSERSDRLRPFIEQLIAEGLALGFSVGDLRDEIDARMAGFSEPAAGARSE